MDVAIPQTAITRIPRPSAETLEELRHSLPLQALSGGLLFVLPEKAGSLDTVAILEIQKLLLHIHYKYIFHPSHSHVTADPLGVRKQTLPDIVRNISTLRNTPWLLGAPLVDKLTKARVGLPVLLLLPGPSLTRVLPHLREIYPRCLIVCIARTLSACLDAGVEPDIVLQLDTYQMQTHYYAKAPLLPQTLLVPLSIAPFYPYAHKFRGVVMMDSFNLEFLPNRARLRENYLSSLTACFGIAEALHAPKAFLAGADLSEVAVGEQHPLAGHYPAPLPLVTNRYGYLLGARDDTLVFSQSCYIATAVEAEHIVTAIEQTSGTAFYSLSDTTLLSRQKFPYIDLESILSMPPIDRGQYSETINRVLAARETIDLTKMRMHLLKQWDDLRKMAKLFALRGQDEVDTMLRDNVITQAAAIMRDVCSNEEVDMLGLAAKACSLWCHATNNARLLVQAMSTAKRGGTVPLLCFPEELQPLSERLAKLLPLSGIEAWGIVNQLYKPVLNGQNIGYNELLPWLASRKVVLASPRVMNEFAHILDYAPSANLYDLRLLTGSSSRSCDD